MEEEHGQFFICYHCSDLYNFPILLLTTGYDLATHRVTPGYKFITCLLATLGQWEGRDERGECHSQASCLAVLVSPQLGAGALGLCSPLAWRDCICRADVKVVPGLLPSCGWGSWNHQVPPRETMPSRHGKRWPPTSSQAALWEYGVLSFRAWVVTQGQEKRQECLVPGWCEPV